MSRGRLRWARRDVLLALMGAGVAFLGDVFLKHKKRISIQYSPLTPHYWAPLIYGGHKTPSPLKGVGATYSYPGYLPGQCDTTVRTLHKMCSWYHNWGSATYSTLGSSEFVPTIYSPGCIGRPLDGNSEYLLTFNEPRGQAESYVDHWIACAEMYGKKTFLPSYHLHRFDWIDKFWAELCRRGKENLAYGMSFHCYPDWYEGASGFMIVNLEEAKGRADDWGLDFWLTEFALDPGGPDGIEGSINVMDAVWNWCKETGSRCAWFQHSFRGDEGWWSRENTSLVDYWSGESTALGRHWAEIE